jgi:hypothetical protein
MTRTIVSNVLLADLLENADPALETQPASQQRAQRTALRASANRIVRACRESNSIEAVAEREAVKLQRSPGVLAAFREFVACVQNAM